MCEQEFPANKINDDQACVIKKKSTMSLKMHFGRNHHQLTLTFVFPVAGSEIIVDSTPHVYQLTPASCWPLVSEIFA